MFPLAHVYPKEERSARELLRRRTHFVRKRAELLAHVQNTSWQYRLEPIGRRLVNRKGHETVPTLFDDAFVQSSVEANLELVGHHDRVIKRLEWQLTKQARIDDRATYDLLRSIPGVGRVLALILLYEIDDVRRFDIVQQFCSYCRLIRPPKTSAGKPAGLPSHKKIGNAHLKWAISEAALLLLSRVEEREGLRRAAPTEAQQGQSFDILSHRLGRALYYMLRRREYFDETLFLKQA